jgi:succinate-semialdehyde dehydrogenase/glutarate-semialdehyde dehydrogenase
MELGGKNPMMVLDDADINKAARVAVWDCFASTGQLCVSIERIYVQSTVYEEFTKQFRSEVESLKLGASYDYTFDVGSLVSAKQLEKMQSHVYDAVSKGATVVAGGRSLPDLGPYFHEPTILEGVTESMEVFAEETFGPLVSLYRFESTDEAIEKANSSIYGLHGSIWTRDTALGRKIAARIQAGTVCINDTYRSTWGSVDSPMGGFKASGIGRRHGAAGIIKYTEPQTVTVQRIIPVGPLKGMSEERFHRLLTAGLKLLRRIPGLR